MIHWWWILIGWIPFWFGGYISHYYAQRWRLDEIADKNAELQRQVLILRSRVIRENKSVCDWEWAPPDMREGKCSRCGGQWTNYQCPAECMEKHRGSVIRD